MIPFLVLIWTTHVLWESARPTRFVIMRVIIYISCLCSRGKHYIIMKRNVKQEGAYVIFHLKVARRSRRKGLHSRATFLFFLSVACSLSGCFLSSSASDTQVHSRWIADGPLTTGVLGSPGCLWHHWLNPYVHMYEQLMTIQFLIDSELGPFSVIVLS